MFQCKFCGYISEDIDDFEEDFKNYKGFWCPYCDGFTYYENISKSKTHNYILFLETKTKGKSNNIKIRSQVSPLRYPGGKSKIIGNSRVVHSKGLMTFINIANIYIFRIIMH